MDALELKQGVLPRYVVRGMPAINLSHLLPLCLAGIGLGEPQAPSTEDLVIVDVAPALRQQLQDPLPGTRLLLYLVDAQQGPPGEPADGPSPFSRQPVASWDLAKADIEFNVESGELRARQPDQAYPWTPSELAGRFRAQVAIDIPSLQPGPQAAGDLLGAVKSIELDPDQREIIRLPLGRVRPEPPTPEHANLVMVERPSTLLPRISSTPTTQRAWVILPHRYHDITAPRRFWPTIYVVPDHGEAALTAERIATLLAREDAMEIVPQAIWVVLDPIGPMGHHYFIDSPINGPRRRALVEELIPWLEVRFRTVAQPDARLLLGEGAGARAALGLLADHPDLFGRAWALSPEAITFSQLGALDLYGAENAFDGPGETMRPAVRSPLGPERDLIHASIRDEALLTHVISPGGRSGRTWDAWRAAFGRPSARASAANWPFELESGSVDPVVVEGWSVHDLLLRANSDPLIAETLRTRSWIICGERDEYYRNRGVADLAGALGIESAPNEGTAIRIIPDATASEASAFGWMHSYKAMSEHLVEHDLHD